ncbi:MAG: hydroxymethylbilane synthase [Lachnospiraceae bacterium]|jgi:hydroxymethylbilane synthase|nr:hydroxymethylbilane synthase [Lachnospiraceae bacterium]
MRTIRIGTRTSALALKQTEMVMQRIKDKYPDFVFEVIPMQTKGDKMLYTSLIEFGGKGAFVKELEEAILEDRIDVVVHSAKDMPKDLSDGLDIWMVSERADARDVLITREGICFDDAKKMVIGTSSPRRKAQIESRMCARCQLLRGNVTTRIEKLRRGLYDGIVLAAAGLKRLELEKEGDLSYHYFSCEEMVPSGGQGIVAVEGRKEDTLRAFFAACSDKKAEIELKTERYILKKLDAGCHEPIGVYARVEKEEIEIHLFMEEKGKFRRGNISGKKEDCLELADRLLEEVGVN